MESLCNLLPKLTATMRKGQCGRIAIIGGSFEYTGAPYFAAITALKMGADLAHVFCHEAAATAIKSYSPSLIVHPGWKPDELNRLERTDCIVMGSGMGRSQEAGLLARSVFTYVAEHEIPAVYDGDAIYWACQTDVHLPKSKFAVYTPNRGEFDRMSKKFLGIETLDEESEDSLHDAVKRVVEQIGSSILLKGAKDYYVTVGHESGFGDFDAGLRRCGGQGDMLAGALGVTLNWALKSYFLFAHMIIFQTVQIGRSVDTPDMIDELPSFLREIEASAD